MAELRTSDYDYELPESFIAQHPADKRDESKLLHINRETGEIEDRHFYDILEYLREGDVLVINNTKVLPARIFGRRKTGGKVEFLLLRETDKDIWEVLVKPGKNARVGERINFSDKLQAEVLSINEEGIRTVKFDYDGVFNEILAELGTMPLPPYIHETLEEQDRYQTVYAEIPGSAAAPTAGLHFTPELLEKIREKGIEIAEITLHVGIGTFRPVKDEILTDHKMHKEYFEISEEAAEKINQAKRVVAVGTTSVRALESATDEDGKIIPGKRDTQIFIYPGFEFKAVDALITNFHLPKSTLLMLISAFYDREKILSAYEHAKANDYRFFSFGDAMFIE